jgi:hypothetical protein
MPDSPESRIARLEQRADDLATDVRTFAPLVRSQAVMEEQLKRLHEDVDRLADAQRAILTRLDEEREARDAKERERLKESRTNRTLLWVACIGLTGTFLSSAAVVVAAVL